VLLAYLFGLVIALRNRLIHRYLAVTPEELWQAASKLTSTIIPSFREWSLSMVRESPYRSIEKFVEQLKG